MKRLPLILLVIMALALCVNTNAWALSSWATFVEDYDRGAMSNAGDDPSQLLGPYDSLTASIPDDAFYQMGDADGYVTVSFGGSIIAGAGADVEVFEYGGFEDFALRLSALGTTYNPTSSSLFDTLSGRRLNKYDFDLADITDGTLVSQITLFDGYHNGTMADIDAVRALTVTPEPLGMTLFLIGGVPIGVRLYRRRKKTVRV